MKQLLILFFAAGGFVACGGSSSQVQQVQSQNQVTAPPATLPSPAVVPSQTADQSLPSPVTEVLYFHGKQRCITCNAIERLTKEVVDSLADAQVVMRIIDISKPENEALADKYEVTWSSLIVVRDGKSTNLTKMGFAYAKGQSSLFKARLEEAITAISR